MPEIHLPNPLPISSRPTFLSIRLVDTISHFVYCHHNTPFLEGFTLPFGGRLNPENRWVKLSRKIPWDELAKAYHTRLTADRGRPAKNARMVIGAVIIKHKLTLSDEETVLQIQENPYLQYFIGLSTVSGGTGLCPEPVCRDPAPDGQ